jgi:hypothetical protein
MVRDLRTANLPEFESSPQDVPGTGTGDVLPLNVAACLTLRTALAGKSFRGRQYFSGFTEAQNDAAGRVAPAVNTAIKNLFDNFGNAMVAHGWTPAVLSRPADAVTIPAKTTPARVGQGNPITASIARNLKWESQRRRTGRT